MGPVLKFSATRGPKTIVLILSVNMTIIMLRAYFRNEPLHYNCNMQRFDRHRAGEVIEGVAVPRAASPPAASGLEWSRDASVELRRKGLISGGLTPI